MVTVYIPVYNLDKYIKKAIDSVLFQTLQDFELIIINDGSTDNTKSIIKEYEENPKIRIVNFSTNKGLAHACNVALKLAEGKYIVRLDGDDILDENALFLMSSILDSKPEVGLVYPDYYKMSEDGKIEELVRKEKINDEICVYDKAPHGACTMYRTEVLKQLQGYETDFVCQNGLSTWLKFVKRYNPYNINIPLFYYRKRDYSLSYDNNKLERERAKIKKFYAGDTNILGIILASQKSIYPKSGALEKLNGVPMIDYTIQAASDSSLRDIVVSTPDFPVREYVEDHYNIHIHDRNVNDNYFVNPSYIALDILNSRSEDYDAICILFANVPLRKSYHIDEAIYTKCIFNFNTVISVEENYSYFYTKGQHGLIPIGNTSREIRVDRDVLLRENGAVYIVDIDCLKRGTIVGGNVGYIVMNPENSVKINSVYEHWLAEQLLKKEDNSVS